MRHTAGAFSTCSHRAGALSPHAAGGLVYCTPLWLPLTHAGRSVLEAGVNSAPPSCSSTWQASCCSTTACLSCHKQHVTPACCSIAAAMCGGKSSNPPTQPPACTPTPPTCRCLAAAPPTPGRPAPSPSPPRRLRGCCGCGLMGVPQQTRRRQQPSGRGWRLSWTSMGMQRMAPATGGTTGEAGQIQEHTSWHT